MNKKIIQLINNSKTIAIFFHINPDGDAIGSSLALKYGLEKLGKKVFVFSNDPIPERLVMFNSNDIILNKTNEKYDLAIVLDCGDIRRIGNMSSVFNNCKNSVNIDHHLANTNFTDVVLCNTETSSTCELIYNLLKDLNIEFNNEICKCLYVGMATDSGSFMFNISKNLHKIVNELIEKIENLEQINYILFREKTKEEIMLYAEAMSRLEFHLNNRLALTYISLKDLEKLNLEQDKTTGLIFLLSGLKDIDVICVVCEEKQGIHKVAFRSNKTNVQALASLFGGGGHKFASGCKIYGGKNLVKRTIIEKTKEYLCTE